MKTMNISLARKDLELFTEEHNGFYGLEISRISSVLITQIMQLHINRVIDTFKILDELKFLEGLKKTTSTTNADVFTKSPLKGLKKKHFTDASFILKNIGIHFSFDYGGNNRLNSLIDKAFLKNKSGYVDQEFIYYISEKITIDALKTRTKKKGITGEWIVFKNHNGKNYYLTLAAHNEGDENIFQRVNLAYDIDFGFLRESS